MRINLSVSNPVAYNPASYFRPATAGPPQTFGRKHMRTLILAVSAAVGLGLAVKATAEDLIHIYDLAVQSDPILKEQEQTLYATREIKPQTRGLLLPEFGVNADADYNSVRSTSRSAITQRRSSNNDRFNSQRVAASITQSVYNRADWIRLDQTDDTIAQAEAQYRDAQIELMVRTTDAYFAVLEAADAVGVQEALERANERQLEQSKQRFDVGLVAITDVNESQAAYDRSRANVITSKNELNDKWEALRKIIGPVNVPIARLGERLPLSPPSPNNIDVWADTAIKNNYTVVAALEATQSAKKQIEIERSGHFPTFDLAAGYELDRTDQRFGSDRDSGFVQLQMNLPLYQGGRVTSRTREAGYNLRAAQDRLDQNRRQVLEQVKNAFRGILSSISDVQARQAAIVSSRSALESTQAGLEVGTRTQVDVLNAQQRLFQAEFDYLSSRYDYILNGVRLHQATSTLTRDVLVKGNAWLNPKDTISPSAN
jgi:outer membrane protein